MSTPNPLIPQGTFQAQAAKGASNVRIAVATIVAIHVVFFGGLLLQGCKRDTQTQDGQTSTNAEPSTNLALPPLESSSLYYNSSTNLPAEAGGTLGTPAGTGYATQTTPATTPDALWPGTNHPSPLIGGNQNGGAQASGATKEYTVVARDYFGKIAKAHGITLSALKAANPNVDPTRIKPGDKLNIPEPVSAAGVAPSESLTTPSTGASAAGSSTIYTVQPNDNLTKIAKNHKVTISQLRAANNLRTSQVRVGQKLKIPPPNPAPSNSPSNL
jgi:LysM repeat protein